eukprot:1160573-Pelagomonas_calceolata.AAC.16
MSSVEHRSSSSSSVFKPRMVWRMAPHRCCTSIKRGQSSPNACPGKCKSGGCGWCISNRVDVQKSARQEGVGCASLARMCCSNKSARPGHVCGLRVFLRGESVQRKVVDGRDRLAQGHRAHFKQGHASACKSRHKKGGPKRGQALLRPVSVAPLVPCMKA